MVRFRGLLLRQLLLRDERDCFKLLPGTGHFACLLTGRVALVRADQPGYIELTPVRPGLTLIKLI